MEGNDKDLYGNHFPEDPKSANIEKRNIHSVIGKQNNSNFDVFIFLVVSAITVFNIALSLFIVIRKFT